MYLFLFFGCSDGAAFCRKLQKVKKKMILINRKIIFSKLAVINN